MRKRSQKARMYIYSLLPKESHAFTIIIIL